MSELLEGVTVKLGGRDFIVPPLNIRAVRKIEPLLQKIEGNDIDSAMQVVYLGLARNYPELTHDEIDDMVDLANLPGLVQAIMGVSGFGPKGPAAATPPSG